MIRGTWPFSFFVRKQCGDDATSLPTKLWEDDGFGRTKDSKETCCSGWVQFVIWTIILGSNNWRKLSIVREERVEDGGNALHSNFWRGIKGVDNLLLSLDNKRLWRSRRSRQETWMDDDHSTETLHSTKSDVAIGVENISFRVMDEFTQDSEDHHWWGRDTWRCWYMSRYCVVSKLLEMVTHCLSKDTSLRHR